MLGRAPVWLKRPFAATFGFGGRLVSALNEKRTLASGEKVDTAHIEVKQVRIPSCSLLCLRCFHRSHYVGAPMVSLALLQTAYLCFAVLHSCHCAAAAAR